jgi:hypothetical protein
LRQISSTTGEVISFAVRARSNTSTARHPG